MTNINLYAEVLTNIRQITLHASLQTTRNEQTQIEISSDKYVITVSHDGESASLYLPTQISGTANVTIPTEKKKELSLRLAIEDTSGLKPASGDRGQLAPWVAEELTSQTSFSCKGCNTLLLAPGKIMEWQNLPSESWHDMLDYWHCHKHGEAEDIGSPAQGENVGLVCVRPSLGLVDNTLFLLHPEDCSGTMVLANEERAKVCCAACSSCLGVQRQQSDGFYLSKSQIAVKLDNSIEWSTCSASVVATARLQSLIESQAARRFVMRCNGPANTQEALLLWAFNPDMYYSSSARPPKPHRAMKIFYQVVNEPNRMLDEDTSLEELCLLEAESAQIRKDLETSTKMLPQAAQAFQEWHVGLLDRHDTTASLEMGNLNPLNQKSALFMGLPKDTQGVDGLLE